MNIENNKQEQISTNPFLENEVNNIFKCILYYIDNLTMVNVMHDFNYFLLIYKNI